MLNVFRKEFKNENKIAYLLNEEGQRVIFRYNKVDREDYREVDILTNIGATEGTLIIRTSEPLDFKTQSKVSINGIIYRVENIYTEDSETENGIYTIRQSPFKYLTMKTMKR